MKLSAFVPPGKAARTATRAVTVEPGFTNDQHQTVVRRAGRAQGDLPGHSVYVLRCTRCGHSYGEAGIRVHQRKCPACAGGKAGLPVPDAERMLFD